MPIDLTSGTDATGLQRLVAALSPLLFGLIAAGLMAYARWGGLDNDDWHRIGWVRGQLDTFDATSLTIPLRDGRSLADERERIQSLWSPDPNVDERVSTQLTTRARNIWARTNHIPALAVRVGVEAMLLLVFAGLVLVPASAFRSGPAAPGGDPMGVATTAVQAATDVIALFPATNIVWAVALTAALTVYGWLSSHALALGGVLLAGAAGIATLDYITGDVDVRLYPSHRRLAVRIIGGGAAIWLAGSLPVVAARSVGYSKAGIVLGATLALVTATGLGLYASQSLWHRFTTVHARLTDTGDGLPVPAEGSGTTGQTTAVTAYLAVRKTVAGLGVVMVPVVIEYLVRAFASGAVVTKPAAFASAPLLTQMLVAGGVIAFMVAVYRIEPDGWRATGAATRRALSRQTIRTALFGRALPWSAVIAVAALGWLFGVSLPVLIVVSLGLGAMLSVGYRQYRKATLRVRSRDKTPSGRNAVTIMADTMETPDGDTVYLARVNRATLAWPDLDGLLDAIIDIGDTLGERGEYKPRLERAYYDELRETGTLDVDDVRGGRRLRAREVFKQQVRPNGCTEQQVEDALGDDFDRRVREQAVQTVLAKGIAEYHDGRYHWHGGK
jgi:hypothetical protein